MPRALLGRLEPVHQHLRALLCAPRRLGVDLLLLHDGVALVERDEVLRLGLHLVLAYVVVVERKPVFK